MELSKFGAAESMSGAASHQLSVELGAALAGDTLTAGGALLNALPVPVYATDASGLLTFFNSAFEKFWGSTPTCGRPVFDQWRMNRPGECEMAPFDWPTSVVLRTGAAVQAVVCEGLREDGSSIVFTSSPAPIHDKQGQLTGTIDVLIDLSAQRAAERELRESEDHYRSAVELSPQMPWTADPDGTILQFNERWCRFTGQSREGALKNAWHTVTNPEDIPDVHRAMGRCLETGEPFDARFRVKTHDGSERWVRARAAARRNEVGSIVRWYGSTEDIHDSVMAQQGLMQAEERYRYAGLATQDVFWDHDFINNTILWSDGLQVTFGYPLTDNLTDAQFWLDRVHPADRDRVASGMADAVAAGHTRWTAEYRFEQGDGSYAHVLDRGALLRSESGAVVRAIGAMLDLTERKRTEAELQLSEERLRLATSAAGLGISDYAMSDGREVWSGQLREIYGISPEVPAGMETFLALLHPDDRPAALEQRRRTLAGDFGHQFRAVRRIIRRSDKEIRWISTEGHVLRTSSGRLHRIIVTVRDITTEKLAQDRALWAATHDSLTELPNKARFQDALEDLVKKSRFGADSSLLLVDLDNFKHVNDTLGHQAGDALLVEAAKRLRNSVPGDAIVARFGGDEFAIILPGVSCEAAVAMGWSILSSLQQPCVVDTRSVDVRASIGVASCPGHGADATTLLQAADIALYAAKGAGRSTVSPYASQMRAGLQKQVSTLRQAREVLLAGTIVPFYQPKVCFDSMAVVGVEALLRWRHPRLGIQSADTMTAAFDDPELSQQIGAAMLQAVLTDIRIWRDRSENSIQVAINASPVEIGRAGYADRVLGALNQFDLPPNLLEVEITETALIGSGVDEVVRELEMLRRAGVSIALDDFGTGFSSLSHLVRFPVDVVKIDRSFVAGLFDARPDRVVVEAILRLSNELGLRTVAEGVETNAQAMALRSLGCTIGQGFLFSPAVEADLLDWNKRYSCLRAE